MAESTEGEEDFSDMISISELDGEPEPPYAVVHRHGTKYYRDRNSFDEVVEQVLSEACHGGIAIGKIYHPDDGLVSDRKGPVSYEGMSPKELVEEYDLEVSDYLI